MRATLLLATAAFTLAACQSAEERRAAETGEVEVRDAPSDEVTALIKAAATKNPIQPGMWKAEMQVLDADLGGEAGQATLAMLKRFQRDTTSCRTADNLKAFDVAALEKLAGACTFGRYVAKGGKVDAQVTCQRENGPVTQVAIQGTTTPTAFDVVTTQQTGQPGAEGYAKVRLRASGRRIGDCPG